MNPKIKDLSKDKSKFFVVAMAMRPGTQLFATKLEYTYFPPRTASNDNFQLSILDWQGMTFYVIQVPRDAEKLCHEIADSIGMNIAAGVPHLYDHTGEKVFPVEGDNVYTLSGQFKGDESAEVNKIFDGDKDSKSDDLKNDTVIRQGRVEEVDNFLNKAAEYGEHSPVMNILFGGDRYRQIKSAFFAEITGTTYGLCTIGSNNIIGLYVVSSCRRNGTGEKLLFAALSHCLETGNTPVHIDVLSSSVMRMIERLPVDLRQHLEVRDMSEGKDLNVLDDRYMADRDWVLQEELE